MPTQSLPRAKAGVGIHAFPPKRAAKSWMAGLRPHDAWGSARESIVSLPGINREGKRDAEFADSNKPRFGGTAQTRMLESDLRYIVKLPNLCVAKFSVAAISRQATAAGLRQSLTKNKAVPEASQSEYAGMNFTCAPGTPLPVAAQRAAPA